MFAGDIDLLEIEGDPALRSGLEALNARVNRYPLGQEQHWVDVLQRPDLAANIVINAHGDQHGIIMPELAADLRQQQPFLAPIGPEQIRDSGPVDAGLVLALACMSGRAEMGAAWLEIGARNYIAPDGYPEAADALIFALIFFWHHLSLQATVPEAFAAATALGRDAELFQLYGNDR